MSRAAVQLPLPAALQTADLEERSWPHKSCLGAAVTEAMETRGPRREDFLEGSSAEWEPQSQPPGRGRRLCVLLVQLDPTTPRGQLCAARRGFGLQVGSSLAHGGQDINNHARRAGAVAGQRGTRRASWARCLRGAPQASEGTLLFFSDTYKKPLGGLKRRSDIVRRTCKTSLWGQCGWEVNVDTGRTMRRL